MYLLHHLSSTNSEEVYGRVSQSVHTVLPKCAEFVGLKHSSEGKHKLTTEGPLWPHKSSRSDHGAPIDATLISRPIRWNQLKPIHRNIANNYNNTIYYFLFYLDMIFWMFEVNFPSSWETVSKCAWTKPNCAHTLSNCAHALSNCAHTLESRLLFFWPLRDECTEPTPCTLWKSSFDYRKLPCTVSIKQFILPQRVIFGLCTRPTQQRP